jgi:N-methylhydantoinase A
MIPQISFSSHVNLPEPHLYIGIDVGGTFTDIVIYDSSTSNVDVVKVSSTNDNPERAILETLQSPSFPGKLEATRLINHATTIATNALITHKGLAKTALITNRGFRDVLEIGRQRRAELYNLRNTRPVSLVQRADRFTIQGRTLFDGKELQPLNKAEVRALSRRISKLKFESVAVGLLNSYVDSRHEKEVRSILKKEGFSGHVSLSSEVNAEYREYERISTTVVNAALAPLVSTYLGNLVTSIRRAGALSPIYIMTSDGNASTSIRASRYPISIIESGPAAGVLACAGLARALSLRKVSTLDMGGTTAKAGMLVDFDPDISYEFEAAGKTHSGRSIKGSGYPVRFPFIDLAEVSAGGGTIAWVDEGKSLRLGPGSAGADPGPAAYGKGGKEPTITDANIVLGRLNPNYLLGGSMKLNSKLSREALEERVASKLGIGVTEAAESIIRVVNHNMAKAISIVSIERGRDPRDFALIAFGGAGPLHACDLAEAMGMRRIVFPEHPGLFSAFGLLTADLARIFSASVLTTDLDLLVSNFEKLEAEAASSLEEEGLEAFKTERFVDLRYRGQSYEFTLEYSKDLNLKKLFDERHKAIYGYSSPDELEAVNVKLKVIISRPKVKFNPKHKEGQKNDLPKETREVCFGGRFLSVPVFVRENLPIGAQGKGPCIIEEYDSTTVIQEGWSWNIDDYGNVNALRESE